MAEFQLSEGSSEQKLAELLKKNPTLKKVSQATIAALVFEAHQKLNKTDAGEARPVQKPEIAAEVLQALGFGNLADVPPDIIDPFITALESGDPAEAMAFVEKMTQGDHIKKLRKLLVGPPIRKTEQPVGRNDPCPCCSGKKFKKCCMGKKKE